MARFWDRATPPVNQRHPSTARWILILVVVVTITGAFTLPASRAPVPIPSVAAIPTGTTLIAQAQASLASAPTVLPTHSPLGPASTIRTWLEVAKPSSLTPPARYLEMMVYDPVDHYVVMFGGHGTTSDFGDTWSYANGHWANLTGGNAPSPRYLAAMVWDAVDGHAILFGGHSATGTTQSYNDTWSFVNGQWSDVTSNSPTAPSQRWRMGLAYDVADRYVLLFGGTDNFGTTIQHDTWNYSGGVWTNITSKVTGSPPGRYRAVTAYDVADGYVLQFAGCVSTLTTCQTSDTWKYHNLTWTQLTPATHPSARVYPGMTYDAAIGAMLLFGGSATPTGGPMRDTWTFLNGTWANLTGLLTNQPTYRGFENMAFYTDGNYTILFGGENDNTATFMGDTWSYGPAVIASVTTAPGTIDLQQNATFNVTAISASSTVTISYPVLPAGCGSANVSLLVCTPTAVGSFRVQVNVSPPGGQNVSLNTSLTVNPDPLLNLFSVAPVSVTSGGSISFSSNVTNGSAPYRYAYSGLPTGCSSRNVWNLSCRPTAVGPFTIQLAVTDNASWTVYRNTTLTVNPRPALSGLTAQPSVLDVLQWTNITSVETGGTLPLTYNYSNLPAGCLTSNVARLTCRPSAAGTYAVLVTVTDSAGFAAFGTVNLTVSTLPTIQSFKVLPTSVDQGQAVTFYLNASGGTGLLNYSYSGSVPGCTLSRTPIATCTPSGPGSFTVTGLATDGVGAVVRSVVTLTVNPDPSILAVNASASFIDLGQKLNITVWATGGTLPYSFVYSGLPLGCPATHVASLNCTPTQAGSPAITVVLTDHWGKTAQSAVSVTINAAPAISGFTATPSPATRGEVVTFAATVTGGSGTYSFAYSSLPTGCSTANLSTLHCTPTSTGVYTVNVRVTDSLGVSVTNNVVVTVQAPASSGNTILGLPASTGYALVGILALIVILVVVGLVLLMRRRGRVTTTETTVTTDAEYPAEAEGEGGLPPDEGMG